MSDELLAVQFLHPGGEHRPGRDGFQGWNLGAHRRKFMKSQGLWLTSAQSASQAVSGELTFWGEWEPPSRVVSELAQPDRRFPRYLVEPLMASPPDSSQAQNTDPFVFGDHFIYSNCRQRTVRGPLRTQRLAPGSMVLFGSYLDGDFVLDTMFVVDAAEWLTPESAPSLEFDEPFSTATVGRLYRQVEELDFRVYHGVTPNSAFAGMFSFTPCMPYDQALEVGFPRPAIRLDGVVNPRNRQALKYTRVSSTDEMRKLWYEVVDQIVRLGLSLGVWVAEPPPIKGPIYNSTPT